MPNDANAYCNRGDVKQESGDHEGAIHDYNKAIEINPNDVRVYHNRGIAKQMSGDHEGAMHDYNKAIEINPKPGGPRYDILQSRKDKTRVGRP